MVTNTQFYANLSVGTTAGQATNAAKIALDPNSTKYVLSAQLVNGARQGNNQKQVIIWHAASPFDITAASAPAQLAVQARRFYLVPDPTPGGTCITKSDVNIAEGAFVYLWLEEPRLEAAASLSAFLAEYDVL